MPLSSLAATLLGWFASPPAVWGQASQQVPPLVKLKALTALLFLLLVLLVLIVLNHLLARWARRSAGDASRRRGDLQRRLSRPDDDDWTRRPLVEKPRPESESADDD